MVHRGGLETSTEKNKKDDFNSCIAENAKTADDELSNKKIEVSSAPPKPKQIKKSTKKSASSNKNTTPLPLPLSDHSITQTVVRLERSRLIKTKNHPSSKTTAPVADTSSSSSGAKSKRQSPVRVGLRSSSLESHTSSTSTTTNNNNAKAKKKKVNTNFKKGKAATTDQPQTQAQQQKQQQPPIESPPKPTVTIKDSNKNAQQQTKLSKQLPLSFICSIPLNRLSGILEKLKTDKSKCLPGAEVSVGVEETSSDDKSNAADKNSSQCKTLCLYCDKRMSTVKVRARHIERFHTISKERRSSSRNPVTASSQDSKDPTSSSPACSSSSAPSTPMSSSTTNLFFSGCSFCSKSPKLQAVALENDLSALFFHLVDFHSDKYFGCKVCAIRFQTAAKLSDHVQRAHSSSSPTSTSKSSTTTAAAAAAAGAAAEDVDNPPLVVVAEEEVVKNEIEKSTPTKTRRQMRHNNMGTDVPSPSTSTSTNQVTSSSSSSTINRTGSMFSNDEPILSRLGLTQNRLPRGRKGIRSRRQTNVDTVKPDPSLITVKTRSKLGRFNTSSEPVETVFRTPTNTRIEPLSCTFDEDFYEKVFNNVRTNLSCHLDGKIGSDLDSNRPQSPPPLMPAIPSTVVKSPQIHPESEVHTATSLAALTAFPTLLTAEQYGCDFGTAKIKRPITRHSWKWKWDSVKKYKYVNEGGKIVKKIKQPMLGLRDLSKLDMWTQLTMRQKHEVVRKQSEATTTTTGSSQCLVEYPPDNNSREEKQRQVDQLNTILDSRRLPQIILEQNEQTIIKLEITDEGFRYLAGEMVSSSISSSIIDDKEGPSTSSLAAIDRIIPANLNLIPSRTLGDGESLHNSVVLSGEWARPRCYVCFGCGARFDKLKALEEHKMFRHPHVYSTHYEIVGRELIEGNLFKHFFIPLKALSHHKEYAQRILVNKKTEYSSVSKSSSNSGNEEESLDSLHSVTASFTTLSSSKLSDDCDTDTKTAIEIVSPFTEPSSSLLAKNDTSCSLSAGSSSSMDCTKCNRNCHGMLELYRHMLDCSGDYAWILAKKKKYRYYGTRRRRQFNRQNVSALHLHRRKVKLTKDENESDETPKKKSVNMSPSTPRLRASDADSIRKMLENLPPKRVCREIIPNATKPRSRKFKTTAGGRKIQQNSTTKCMTSNTALTAISKKILRNHKLRAISEKDKITRTKKILQTNRKSARVKSRLISNKNVHSQNNKTNKKTETGKGGIVRKIGATTKRFVKNIKKRLLGSSSSKPAENSNLGDKVDKFPEEEKKPTKTSSAVRKLTFDKELEVSADKEDTSSKGKASSEISSSNKDEPDVKNEKLESSSPSGSLHQIPLITIETDSEPEPKKQLQDTISTNEDLSLSLRSEGSTENLHEQQSDLSASTEDLHRLNPNSSFNQVSPTTKRRSKKINDCIAMLTGKIQEKLGKPFLECKETQGKAQTNPETKIVLLPSPEAKDTKPTKRKALTRRIVKCDQSAETNVNVSGPVVDKLSSLKTPDLPSIIQIATSTEQISTKRSSPKEIPMQIVKCKEPPAKEPPLRDTLLKQQLLDKSTLKVKDLLLNEAFLKQPFLDKPALKAKEPLLSEALLKQPLLDKPAPKAKEPLLSEALLKQPLLGKPASKAKEPLLSEALLIKPLIDKPSLKASPLDVSKLLADKVPLKAAPSKAPTLIDQKSNKPHSMPPQLSNNPPSKKPMLLEPLLKEPPLRNIIREPPLKDLLNEPPIVLKETPLPILKQQPVKDPPSSGQHPLMEAPPIKDLSVNRGLLQTAHQLNDSPCTNPKLRQPQELPPAYNHFKPVSTNRVPPPPVTIEIVTPPPVLYNEMLPKKLPNPSPMQLININADTIRVPCIKPPQQQQLSIPQFMPVQQQHQHQVPVPAPAARGITKRRQTIACAPNDFLYEMNSLRCANNYNNLPFELEVPLDLSKKPKRTSPKAKHSSGKVAPPVHFPQISVKSNADLMPAVPYQLPILPQTQIIPILRESMPAAKLQQIPLQGHPLVFPQEVTIKPQATSTPRKRATNNKKQDAVVKVNPPPIVSLSVEAPPPKKVSRKATAQHVAGEDKSAKTDFMTFPVENMTLVKETTLPLPAPTNSKKLVKEKVTGLEPSIVNRSAGAIAEPPKPPPTLEEVKTVQPTKIISASDKVTSNNQPPVVTTKCLPEVTKAETVQKQVTKVDAKETKASAKANKKPNPPKKASPPSSSILTAIQVTKLAEPLGKNGNENESSPIVPTTATTTTTRRRSRRNKASEQSESKKPVMKNDIPPPPEQKEVPEKGAPTPSALKEVQEIATPMPSAHKEVQEKAPPKPSALKKVQETAAPTSSVFKEAQEIATPMPSALKEVQETTAPTSSVFTEVQEKAPPKPSALKKVQETAAPTSSVFKEAQEIATPKPSVLRKVQETTAPTSSEFKKVKEKAPPKPSALKKVQETPILTSSLLKEVKETATPTPSALKVVQEIAASFVSDDEQDLEISDLPKNKQPKLDESLLSESSPKPTAATEPEPNKLPKANNEVIDVKMSEPTPSLESDKQMESVEENEVTSTTDNKESEITTNKQESSKKPRRRRNNELASIVADQLMESFKETDKSRIEDLMRLKELAYEKSEDLLLTGMRLMPTTKRKNVLENKKDLTSEFESKAAVSSVKESKKQKAESTKDKPSSSLKDDVSPKPKPELAKEKLSGGIQKVDPSPKPKAELAKEKPSSLQKDDTTPKAKEKPSNAQKEDATPKSKADLSKEKPSKVQKEDVTSSKHKAELTKEKEEPIIAQKDDGEIFKDPKEVKKVDLKSKNQGESPATSILPTSICRDGLKMKPLPLDFGNYRSNSVDSWSNRGSKPQNSELVTTPNDTSPTSDIITLGHKDKKNKKKQMKKRDKKIEIENINQLRTGLELFTFNKDVVDSVHDCVTLPAPTRMSENSHSIVGLFSSPTTVGQPPNSAGGASNEVSPFGSFSNVKSTSSILRPSILAASMDVVASTTKENPQQAAAGKSSISSRDPRLNKNIHTEEGDVPPETISRLSTLRTRRKSFADATPPAYTSRTSRSTPSKRSNAGSRRNSLAFDDDDDDNYLTAIAKRVNEKIMSAEDKDFNLANDGFELANSFIDQDDPFGRPSTSMSVRSAPNFNEDRSNMDTMDATNTDLIDMDLDDDMSVYTTFSQDTTRSKGGRRRRRRRSVLLTRKPKKTNINLLDPMDTFDCLLCNKKFAKAASLNKHQLTIAHVSKVSEQEYLNATRKQEEEKAEAQRQTSIVSSPPKAITAQPSIVKEVAETPKQYFNAIQSIRLEENNIVPPRVTETQEKPTVDKVQKPHQPKVPFIPPNSILNQSGIEPISSPEQNYERYSTKTSSRLTLNPDERLFYECCNILKGSETPLVERTYPIVPPTTYAYDLQIKPVTPKSPNERFSYIKQSGAETNGKREAGSYPRLDINQFSDISSDSNPACAQPPPVLPVNYAQMHVLSGAKDQAVLPNDEGGGGALRSNLPRESSILQMASSIISPHPVPVPLTARTFVNQPSQLGTHLHGMENSAALGQKQNFISPLHSASSQSSTITTTTCRLKTKAAMKGYDNLKVSIPTIGLDMEHALERSPRPGCKLTTLADIALGHETPLTTFTPSSLQMHNEQKSKSKQKILLPSNNEIAGHFPPAILQTTNPTNQLKQIQQPAEIIMKKRDISPIKESSLVISVHDTESCMPIVLSSPKKPESIIPKDIYEFDDSENTPISKAIQSPFKIAEDNDNGPKKAIIIPERPFKNIGMEEKEGIKFQKPETPAINDENSASSGSYSDRDDFVYGSMSGGDDDNDNDNDNDNDDNKETHLDSDESSNSSAFTAKTFENKSLIMGRIFKNAKTKPKICIEKPLLPAPEPPKQIPKQELDRLFDTLRGMNENRQAAIIAGKEERQENTSASMSRKRESQSAKRKATTTTAATSKAAKSKPATTNKPNKRATKKVEQHTSKEMSQLHAELGMSPAEIAELIGEGQRKSQRRCAVNRPKKLVDIWSSDEFEEFLSTKDIIALIEEKEQKTKKKRKTSSKKSNSISASNEQSVTQSEDDKPDSAPGSPQKSLKNNTPETSKAAKVANATTKKPKTTNSKKKLPTTVTPSPSTATPPVPKVTARAPKQPSLSSSGGGGRSDIDAIKNNSSPFKKPTQRNIISKINTAADDSESDFETELNRRKKTAAAIRNRRKTVSGKLENDAGSSSSSTTSTNSAKKNSSKSKSDSRNSSNANANTNTKSKPKPPSPPDSSQSRPQARRKRIASEMLYYWSSSSDEEFGRIESPHDDEHHIDESENYQQHGWIVGDSHKKLVTLLAIAKGNKKVDDCGVKEISSKKKS